MPGTYAELAGVVRTAANGSEPFGGWLIWPVTSAIAARAVEEDSNTAFDDAMADTARLVRHALRTLIKASHPAALELLGFAHAAVEIDGPLLDRRTVAPGGSIRFTATIRNTGTEAARLSIDYVIHHRKANGGQTGKTFKLATCTLAPGEVHTIDREHSFRPISTRRYYPGGRAIEFRINGIASDRITFDLEAEPA